MQGFLVPSFIDFDQFVIDKKELPEWTRVVFEKEFEKQKPSLDIMAKKLYSTHSLTEVIVKLQRPRINTQDSSTLSKYLAIAITVSLSMTKQ